MAWCADGKMACILDGMYFGCHVFWMSCVLSVMYFGCHDFGVSCILDVMYFRCHVLDHLSGILDYLEGHVLEVWVSGGLRIGGHWL